MQVLAECRSRNAAIVNSQGALAPGVVPIETKAPKGRQ